MTPKEKAINWMNNYTDEVKLYKSDVEESVVTALKEQAKQIFEDLENYLAECGDDCDFYTWCLDYKELKQKWVKEE